MSSDRQPKSKPRFLNVDLEIEAPVKLDTLAAEMGKRVRVLFCDVGSRPKHYLLSVEIGTRLSSRESAHNPDRVIRALCDVIEKLSPTGRRLWNRSHKVFDIGYELRPSECSSRFSLQPETLQRITKLKAGLVVTYYRGETEG